MKYGVDYMVLTFKEVTAKVTTLKRNSPLLRSASTVARMKLYVSQATYHIDIPTEHYLSMSCGANVFGVTQEACQASGHSMRLNFITLLA